MVERLMWVGAITAGLVAGQALPALAHHSVKSPAWFWDKDNNGVANGADSSVKYQRLGSGWTTNKEQSFQLATDAWRNFSHYNPDTYPTTNTPTVRVDGSICPGESWTSSTLAANCVKGYDRGTFIDVIDSDIYVDLTPGGGAGTWEFDETAQPSATDFSLRGVFTHEVGHGASMKDLYAAIPCDDSSGIFTMCGAVSPGLSTWRQRDLHPDDVDSANTIY